MENRFGYYTQVCQDSIFKRIDYVYLSGTTAARPLTGRKSQIDEMRSDFRKVSKICECHSKRENAKMLLPSHEMTATTTKIFIIALIFASIIQQEKKEKNRKLFRSRTRVCHLFLFLSCQLSSAQLSSANHARVDK